MQRCCAGVRHTMDQARNLVFGDRVAMIAKFAANLDPALFGDDVVLLIDT